MIQPRIATSPPGSRSKALAQLKDAVIPKGVKITVPIYIAKADRSIVEDVDGNRYIDFTSGIGVVNAGHSHPQVIKAVIEQINQFSHTCFMVIPYGVAVTLAERLGKLAPCRGSSKTLFVNTGAEAVENAVKIARYYTGRSKIIVFDNAFHGRTLLTLTMTASVNPYKRGFGPFAPEVYRAPFPYIYRCKNSLEPERCAEACLQQLDDLLRTQVGYEEAAAIVLEPVQGEGGIIVPPKEFMKGVESLCKERDILLIADEVQSGMGRTGRMFALEHYNIHADLICIAKSIASGLPLGAVIGRAQVMDAPHVGSLGGTFGGNPVACAAANATLDIIESSMQNAEQIGEIMRMRLEELQSKHKEIGDVRGLGPMLGVEFVKHAKEPDPEAAKRVISNALARGLLLMGAGTYGNVVRFLPPINTSTDLIESGMQIFSDSLG